MTKGQQTQAATGLEIAVIGMAGRFPGARNVEEYWGNLKNGVESVRFFTDGELEAAGVDPEMIRHPRYVKAKAVVPDAEWFDSDFFDYSPREAEVIDPQLRMFHECAWEALEHAGYDTEQTNGAVGLFAGASASIYWQLVAMLSRSESTAEQFAALALSDKDFLSTRIAHKLNLKGPSVNVDSACSTSLLAIHLACRALLMGECRMALAGGVTVTVPHTEGYLYEEGMVSSPDGHCRAFDARAKGTVGGEGAGVVVLKPLKQAVADGDHIYAVIKGSAANNDGTRKIGYSAPSIEGQAEVIRAAQRMSRVTPESISYVEAHGTGTTLGDPVEIEALKLAFQTEKTGFCRIGSVKTNIGHLNSAAGIAAFIKTVLSLEHKQLPPSLHYDTPNPKIDFANSPFVVNTELTAWTNEHHPLRAGVSSFGIGGTNVHVVLEEAPPQADGDEGRALKLLLLSAKTESGLEQATVRMREHLRTHPDMPLSDAAYTLHIGRRAFRHRRMLVCSSVEEAQELLATMPPERVHSRICDNDQARLVFMFPGQGAQYVNMGLDLYNREPDFRKAADRCFDIVRPLLGADLKEILYPAGGGAVSDCGERIKQTDVTQPVMFIFSYALAQLLMKWGLKPSAMIGHSAGEYVAACLAGVMSLEEALELVVLRGRLMHSVPPGAMLSVPLSEQELEPFLDDDLSLAAVNGAALCVVSGPYDAIDRLERQLAEKGQASTKLHTSHAFHSAMMEPILQPFREKVSGMTLRKPVIPYISNVSGSWITEGEAAAADYWVRHLRGTVRFADGLRELLRDDKAVFVEVGPGNALSAFVRRHPDKTGRHAVVNLVRHPKEQARDDDYLLQQVGRLWLEGARLDWKAFHAYERRKRTALPTYPFERRRYWVDPPFETDVLKQGLVRKQTHAPKLNDSVGLAKKETVQEWMYTPVWERSLLREELVVGRTASRWLVFIAKHGIGALLASRLKQAGHSVITIYPSDAFTQLDGESYQIAPGEPEHYARLLRELTDAGTRPDRIVHAWLAAEAGKTGVWSSSYSERVLDRGFYSLIALAQAIGASGMEEELHISVITSNMQEVTGDERLQPEQAAVLGACLVIPQEYANVRCRSIDIASVHEDDEPKQRGQHALTERLYSEITASSADMMVAYRGTYRWVQKYVPVPAAAVSAADSGLREQGVYLITGGLGGIGLALAEHLAKTVQAKLILIGRSGLPGGTDWRHRAAEHPADEALTAKLMKLEELERHGAEVLVCNADVCDVPRMEQIVAQAVARFGAIHGVIHAAGTADGALIQRRTREIDERALAAKVTGTRVLGRVLEGMRLDFVLLCSSLVSVLGAVGQAGYCAANAYLDAYAYYKRAQDGTHVVSIDWDGWQVVGMAAAAEQEIATASAQAGVRAQGPDNLTRLLPEEGVAVFRQALGFRLPQVTVSTVDLPLRMQAARASSLQTLIEGEQSGAGPKAIRPDVSTAYVPPEDELEQTMAELWRDYLGIDQVGAHDNFFELGATSLDMIQMNTKLQRALQHEVSVVDMFSHPTVHALAESLRRARAGEPVAEETADRSGQIHEGKHRLKQRLQKRDRT
ncbi:SDR family NAD(P)-dependent oxidoreductase [Paenibacillus sp. MER TA 81-3]|uniref:type I polyketide synthase n=1 Tax=Paenibacillus sp. MER TA 81-3 TaxID=2939573 RepID=UPI00203B39CF|nr:type I polyketide synthase [Paenibacillus sp. MER TA 81-3]MCM3337224.1 SDR family NAD(P)-dependent oxidoreductase [Paenibacillus sp. MER TA 81-3]